MDMKFMEAMDLEFRIRMESMYSKWHRVMH